MWLTSAVASGVLARQGCSIHYWLSGPSERPLVVLLHGASLDHHSFHWQIPALAQYYNVLTWDMRGHGLSRPNASRLSLHQITEDLLALLDCLGYEQAIFVGVSMGGNIAQELAFFYPERVKALVALDCSCNTLPLTPLRLLRLLPYSPMALRLCPYNLYKYLAVQTCSHKVEEQAYIYKVSSLLSKQETIATHASLNTCLHYEPGYTIPQPLLLMHGDGDKLGRLDKDMQCWSARDAHSRYITVPDARHCSNQDNPAFVNHQLLLFLHDCA